MTPKEKADDLRKKYVILNEKTDVCFGDCNDLSICDGTGHGCGRWNDHAKEAAIICVEEIIKQVEEMVFNYDMDDHYQSVSPSTTIIPYWNEVLTELKK